MGLLQAAIALVATLIGGIVAALSAHLTGIREQRHKNELWRHQQVIGTLQTASEHFTAYRSLELQRLHARVNNTLTEDLSLAVRLARVRCQGAILTLTAVGEEPQASLLRQIIEEINGIGHAATLETGLAISRQASESLFRAFAFAPLRRRQ